MLELVKVTLVQGDVRFSAAPAILATVLGSCVSVCLWDRVRGFGGMNHFVLPSDRNGVHDTRYGDVAIDALKEGLMGLGSRIGDLRAKVFGGAAVLPFGDGDTVGARNVALAMEWLHRHQIEVAARRTGGTNGQQVKFHTQTGVAMVRYILAARADGTGRAA